MNTARLAVTIAAAATISVSAAGPAMAAAEDSETTSSVNGPASTPTADVALPYQDSAPWHTPYERERDAWERMSSTLMAAGGLGATAGLIAGGVSGCAIGAAIGATVTAPLLDGLGAGPIAGCLAGVPIGAGVGAVGGALVITAPISIAAIGQYLATINEPFVPAQSTEQN